MKPERADRELDWVDLIEKAITMPGSVGNTYNRFYNYSFLNQVLLMAQGVREPVATYKRWQELGRQVLRGSKAAEIVRPIFVKREDDEGHEQTFTRFKRVKCLFGVSQTEGEELPPAEIPDWSLARALGALAIEQVAFTELNGNIAGYSYERKFALNPVAIHPVKTTFHELAHIVLGHTEPPRLLAYQEHRGIMEWEAETTAYLSLNELELLDEQQAYESRGYVQGWLHGHSHQITPKRIAAVFKATDTILKAGYDTGQTSLWAEVAA